MIRPLLVRARRVLVTAASLLLASQALAQPKVAIVAAADASSTNSRFTDPQAKLLATGQFAVVDIINVTSPNALPTLATLQTYDAVIVWSNVNFTDAVALGDLLADYVDSGRGVVNAVFSNSTTAAARIIGGRFITGGYEIIPSGGGSSTGSTTLGTIDIPNHPIMTGVTNLSSGSTGSRPTSLSLTPGSVRVAAWADGRTLVAVSSTPALAKRVDLGLYPPSSDSTSGFWVSSTDGARLMANALVYAAGGSSASLNPGASGTATPSPIIAGGGNVNLNVTAFAGTNPASTGMAVSANLSQFGIASPLVLTDNGGNNFTGSFAVPANQTPGQYTIPLTVTDAQSRTGGGNVQLRVQAAVPAGFVVETEPNDSKLNATAAEISSGQGVYGFSTGSSTTVAGDGSADYYTIRTAAAPLGIYRHRMIITTSGTAGHTGTLRGLTQTTGNINPGTDATLQTSSTTSTPPRFNQWYGFGKRERMYYRVTGGTSTLDEYISTLETTPVTPLQLSTTLTPGSITISRSDATTSFDLLIFDSQLNPVGDFLIEGTAALTRTFTPGTYYMAVSNTNTADLRPSPADATARSSAVLELDPAVANSSTLLVAGLAMTFTDSVGPTAIATPKEGPFDVAWVSFTVGGGATAGCNPADIACDNGDPLASNPGCTNSNLGPNEGDYNAFFAANGFFFQSGQGAAGIGGYCDIACDNGDPLSGNPGCTNNGVNEGDYNCFFNNLFLPCV